ncbi:MAG TPA: BrnA antitoxin family protein [Candidatus Saccharimonadales bacterium]
MSDNIKYTDAPADIEQLLETAVVITKDLLPSPAELVRKSEKERITIAIDKHSLDLFKRYAKQHNAKYQTMINGVLGSYAEKFLSHK